MAPPALNPEVERVRETLYKLIITQLKAILKSEGLPVSGVKLTLQARLIGRKSSR